MLQVAQLSRDFRDRAGAVHRFSHHRLALHLSDVLAEVADGDAAVHRYLALVRLLRLGDEAEERRFAGAVRADEPDVLAAMDDGGGTDEEHLPSVLQRDVVEADHGR